MDKKESQETNLNIEGVDESPVQTEDVEKDKGETGLNESRLDKDPLQKQLEKKEKEFNELRDTYLRFQAETENFKRRMREEKAKDILFANERLIKAFLPLYENLGRALSAKDFNIKSLKQGVDMIFKEFTSVLEKEKVKPIPAIGETFDPAVHEALSQLESKEHEDQTVIQEISKGFLINDRVLCPAKVVISKKPSELVDKEEQTIKPIPAEKKSGDQPKTDQVNSADKKVEVDKSAKFKKQKKKY